MKLARTAAAVAAAALIVLLPSSANAASLLRADTVGDVQLITLDDSGNPTGDPVVMPDRTIGDVTKTRITHGSTSVRVEMYYRSLPKAGSYNDHEFRFVTSKLERTVSVEAGTGNWAGKATMYYKSGSKYSCSGLKFLIDYPNHRVILTVPRTCLGNPTFVKVGSGFIAVAGTKLYLDDAQLNAGNANNLTLSPGVLRN